MNIMESPPASVRLRTSAAKRLKKVESAAAHIWKRLAVAGERFRRHDRDLDACHLLRDVYEGRNVGEGKPVSTQQPKAAPLCRYRSDTCCLWNS